MTDHERIDDIERIMEHEHTGRCMDNPGKCECGVDRFWGRIVKMIARPIRHGSGVRSRLDALEKASKEHYISTHDIALEQEEMDSRISSLCQITEEADLALSSSEDQSKPEPVDISYPVPDNRCHVYMGPGAPCGALLPCPRHGISDEQPEPTDEEWKAVLDDAGCAAAEGELPVMKTEEILAKQVIAERKRADEYRDTCSARVEDLVEANKERETLEGWAKSGAILVTLWEERFQEATERIALLEKLLREAFRIFNTTMQGTDTRHDRLLAVEKEAFGDDA